MIRGHIIATSMLALLWTAAANAQPSGGVVGPGPQPGCPLSGCTFTGPIVVPTLTMGSSSATGLGTAIGQIPLFINFQSSGLPGLLLSSRMIIARSATTSTDFTDLQLQRVTSFSGGTTANINAMLRVIGSYGANDGTQNWNAVFQSTTAGTAGGLAVGSYSTAFRAVGGSDGVWGTISASTDQNDTTSALSGRQVIGHEIDLQSNKADDGNNGSSFGGTGIRKALNIAAVRFTSADTTQTEVSHGLWFTTVQFSGVADTHTNFQSAIGFGSTAQIRNALDVRGAITPSGSANPVSAVTMDAGQVIDFNGPTTMTAAPRNYLTYDSGTSKLFYVVSGTNKFSVDASGNVRAAGTVTPSVTP